MSQDKPSTAHTAPAPRSERNNESAVRQNADYSKSKSVVRTDLLIRVVTALSVAAIGFASFKLQRDTSTARDESTKKEAQEQRYLPFFRSVSEVNLALGQVSAEFAWPKFTEAEALRENALGSRMAYLADSLYFPTQDFQANEPKIRILKAADNAYGTSGGQPIELSAENAVRMLSELMRMAPVFRTMTNKGGILVEVKDGRLNFETDDGKKVDFIPIDARSVSAFNTWIPERTKVDYLWDELDLSSLSDDIAGQLTTVTRKILAEHPELADKYVSIRNDVIRGREEIVPSAK